MLRLSNAQREALGISIVLGLALLLRAINLDADPSALISRDFITDEGWWAHNTRNALFFGQWRLDNYNPGLYSASLYNYLLYFFLKMLGPSFVALRLLPALTGWLTVVLLFFWVRRASNTRTAIMAALLLGFSNLHILYSRTGFVESSLGFFLVLTLWLWALRQKHYLLSIAAGSAFALMILTKVTAIYMTPGFALLSICEMIRGRVSRREALLFICGGVLTGAVYAAIFILPDAKEWVWFNMASGSDQEWSSRPDEMIYSILRFIGSRFYLETPLITALTLVALGKFIVGISKDGVKKTIREASDLETTGSALLIGYGFALALTVYQPERRFIPALPLMSALSANVLCKGWQWLKGLDEEGSRMGAGAWFALLFLLPAIVILRLKWVWLGSPLTARHWIVKAPLIIALILISSSISRHHWPYNLRSKLLSASRAIFVLSFFALSLVLIYQALSLWGLNSTAKLSAQIGSTLVLTAVALSCAMLKVNVRRAGMLLAAFLFIEAIQISTWLLQPTYTIKETNDELSALMTDEDTVITRYETVLLSSRAKVICYWLKHGYNVDAYERFDPSYTLVLRRDDWKDQVPQEVSANEWPPPVKKMPKSIRSFELCPVKARGPRFVLELYSFKK
jgi:4-amino-4-deoxy-L-arabinose transferase-like glycosyltransferase